MDHRVLEYRDERDRLLAGVGFSEVGGLALIVSVVDAITALIVQSVNPESGPSHGFCWVASVQLMLHIWSGANRVAAQQD